MTLRAKGKKDITNLVINKLNAVAPRTHELVWDVSRSTVQIASRIRYKLTTGIDSFDTVLGGGLPFGRVVELYGLESSGKTALVMRCAARLQGRNILQREQIGRPGDSDFCVNWVPVPKNVDVFTLYIDNEQSLDEDDKLIVDGEVIDVAVCRTDTVDQMMKMIDVAISTIDEAQDAEHPCFILVVVDTVGGTSSREEMKAKWDAQDYPRQPAMLRKAFRRMMRKINKRNVLAIFTNQVGASFKTRRQQGQSGLPQDEDFNSPGGKALKFFASVRIFMYQVNPAYKLHKEQQFPAGFSAGFVTVKNRLAKPRRAGRFVLLYDLRGISNIFSTLETMIFLKVARAGEEGDRGAISFRFRNLQIDTTTFDADETKRGDPRLECRAQWPAFYEAHKADLDLLWEKAKTLLFALEGDVGIADASLGEDKDPDLDLPEGTTTNIGLEEEDNANSK